MPDKKVIGIISLCSLVLGVFTSSLLMALYKGEILGPGLLLIIIALVLGIISRKELTGKISFIISLIILVLILLGAMSFMFVGYSEDAVEQSHTASPSEIHSPEVEKPDSSSHQ